MRRRLDASTTAAPRDGAPPHRRPPTETAEWRERWPRWSAAPARSARADPATMLAAAARARRSIGWQPDAGTPYVNTIAVDAAAAVPRATWRWRSALASLMRWNALAMVVRANQAYGELGGHIASYASAADLFEVGFNHFFRARRRRRTAATWCSSSRTARPASMRAPSSKGG